MKAFTLTIYLLMIVLCINPVRAQVVTNTADAGPGSLRQAMIDANLGMGNGEIIFNIPKTDPNFQPERGVYTITVKSTLPEITASHITINGASQSMFSGNTNLAILKEFDLIDHGGLKADMFESPEIEIVGKPNLEYGIKVNAPFAHIQGLAIVGFGNQRQNDYGNIVLTYKGHRSVIENNYLGIYADSSQDPGERKRSGAHNITGTQADSVEIKNNIIAWGGNAGIYLTNQANAWIIQENLILHNGKQNPEFDGVQIELGKSTQVKWNTIAWNSGNGIDTYLSEGELTFTENIIAENGDGQVETSGIRLYGKDNLIERNIIANNKGAGVLVTSFGDKNLITQNSIYNNGQSPGNPVYLPIGIDMLSAHQNHLKGNPPFFTLNDQDDLDHGGNDLLNFPVLDQVMIQGNQLIVSGWARPGATIEFFMADDFNKTHPQGKKYLFTSVEGSSDDLDTTMTAYSFPGFAGEDDTHRFEFRVAKSILPDQAASLVTTASLDHATSEFSPVMKIKNNPVVATSGCLQILSANQFQINLGYINHSDDTVLIKAGEENYFINSDEAPPTLFYPGTVETAVTIPIESQPIFWVLQGDTLQINPTHYTCPIDAGVTLMANKAIVEKGDTVTFTATLQNESQFSVNDIKVELDWSLGATFMEIIDLSGNFQPITKEWSVQVLEPGEQVSMIFSLMVIDNTLVEATITQTLQTDENSANDYSLAHVAIDESTSGTDGGTESNGNLATKMAQRKYHQASSQNKKRVLPYQIFNHQKASTGEVKSIRRSSHRSRISLVNQPLLFLPEKTTNSEKAVVVTPTDLIHLTNAKEIFSLDYLNKNVKRVGSVLFMETSGEVYEHTKPICDRLAGGALQDIQHVYILDKPFILSRIDHPDGKIDYAINLVAYQSDNQWNIDNRWRIEEYKTEYAEEVLNFQVWSVSPNETMQMVEYILRELGKRKQLHFINEFPSPIPNVYIQSGYYSQGSLHLTIVNKSSAHQANLWGTMANVEDGERNNFFQEIPLQSGIQKISIPYKNFFDAGIAIANNLTGGTDAVYFADGPWGLDYERDGAKVAHFEVMENSDRAFQDSIYLVERNAHMAGTVKTYASLFRNLTPDLSPQNLSHFNQINFSATGEGNFEMILTKKSINDHAEQFRYYFNLSGDENQFYVPYQFLVNRNGEKAGAFEANDITSIVFNALGNQFDYQPFSIMVSNLEFSNHSVKEILVTDIKIKDGNIKIYPNPVTAELNIMLHAELESVSPEAIIFDTTGKKLLNLGNGTQQNEGLWTWRTPLQLPSGIYLLSIGTTSINGRFKFVKQ